MRDSMVIGLVVLLFCVVGLSDVFVLPRLLFSVVGEEDMELGFAAG